MTRNGLLLIVWMLLPVLKMNAQPADRPAYFSGKLTSELGDIELYLIVFDDSVAWENPQLNRIKVDKSGAFSFQVKGPFDDPHEVRITLKDMASSTILINQMRVEAGDSICLRSHISSYSLDLDRAFGAPHPTVHFSGSGAGKYITGNAVDAVTVDDFVRDTDITHVPARLSRIIAQKLDTLRAYRNRLTAAQYGRARIDILCKMKSLGYDRIRGSFEEMPSIEERQRQETIFQKINALYPDISDEMLASSPLAGRYLEARCVREMLFANGWKPFYYEDYYAYIKAHRKGLVRDKIIAYSLLSENLQAFYAYRDYQNYSRIIADASDLVRSPAVKAHIEHLASIRAKGAEPFNFSLPADSSQRLVRLSDFKGKVVLIDMWGYICTGCYMFANTFHKEVYPLFKDNPNFKVISILTGDTPYENYLKRLRNEIVRGSYREPPYTFPEYINLFAGQGIKSGKQMEDYYQANISPIILLIGKDGKIYSSRIPFFIDSNSPNVEKLVALIREALEQPDVYPASATPVPQEVKGYGGE